MAAIIAGLDYTVTAMLQGTFLQMGPHDRITYASNLIAGSRNSERLTGIAAGNEAAAEYLADVTARMREHVEHLVHRALEGASGQEVE